MSRSVARRPHDVAPCVRVLADDLTGALDSADGNMRVSHVSTHVALEYAEKLASADAAQPPRQPASQAAASHRSPA